MNPHVEFLELCAQNAPEPCRGCILLAKKAFELGEKSFQPIHVRDYVQQLGDYVEHLKAKYPGKVNAYPSVDPETGHAEIIIIMAVSVDEIMMIKVPEGLQSTVNIVGSIL